jgi:hypothetical protein
MHNSKPLPRTKSEPPSIKVLLKTTAVSLCRTAWPRSLRALLVQENQSAKPKARRTPPRDRARPSKRT